MQTTFPFGYDSALSGYLTIHVLTLAAHAFLMTYVLAGSAWLAWATVCPGTDRLPRFQQPLAVILRDWMPFVLSGAITAGVAPLLFVQILYRQQFYTANLLLGPRWMIVIPVLVLAFYLLYVIKSRVVTQWSLPVRCGLVISTASCFLFVAFCWTTNSLLMTAQADWPMMYATGRAVLSPTALALRLLIWVSGAFPMMSVLAAWQLWGMRRRAQGEAQPGQDKIVWIAMHDLEERRLSGTSVVGTVVSFLAAVSYLLTLEQSVARQVYAGPGLAWLLTAGGSALVLVACWIRRTPLTMPRRAIITVASVAMLLATVAMREVIRLAQLDQEQIAAAIRSAAGIGGFGVFVLFLVINTGLIVWCLRLIRKQSGNQAMP